MRKQQYTFWSVGRLNCCSASPAVILVPSRSMTKVFCSLLDMYVFRNGVSSSTEEGSVFLCRSYVCCTAVSGRVSPRCHGVQLLRTLCSLCHCTILSNIYARYTKAFCVQACAAGYALIYLTIPKLQSASSSVEGLTAAKFNPIILFMPGFPCPVPRSVRQ
jgi:hypothetical protein